MTSQPRMQFGVLLPHFSQFSTWERLIGFAPRIEALGFDSVWVRDNLSFVGHGFELPGNRFVDPFVTLSTIAGGTSRLKLGTAVVIPFRHPLVTAQLFGSLAWVAQGRVEAGLGPGTPTKPFEVTGIPYEDRIQLCKETAEVLRVVAQGPHAAYRGQHTCFEDVTLEPAPPADMTIWYGGASNASIRRILDYADGMMPGRCPFPRYDVARERLLAGAAERGKQVKMGAIPIISMGRTREEALSGIDLEGLLQNARNRWKGAYERAEDLSGGLIVGTVDDCQAEVAKYAQRGLDTLVFDARLRMEEFEEAIEQIGQEVIPAFR